MSIPAIELIDVTAGYMGHPIQNHVSFRIEQGEIVALLGGSGCGKSTMLKTIIGLLPVISGDVRIAGESIINCTLPQKHRILRKFGVAFQNGALFRSYTLAENIALPLQEYTNYSKEKIDQIVSEKLKIVGLEGAGNKMPGDLSGGMVKRGAVARALALDPGIIFLDEPSAGLDPLNSSNLDQLILEIRRKFNSTIMIVTHELDSIFTVADRVIFLDSKGGGILAQGSPEELRDSCNIPFVRSFLNRGKV